MSSRARDHRSDAWGDIIYINVRCTEVVEMYGTILTTLLSRDPSHGAPLRLFGGGWPVVCLFP